MQTPMDDHQLIDMVLSRTGLEPTPARVLRLSGALAALREDSPPDGADGQDPAPTDETRPTDDCGREPGAPGYGEPCGDGMRQGDDEKPADDEAETEAAPDAESEEVAEQIASGAVLVEIEGYASIFDRLDARGTMMAPGAFAEAVAAGEPLWIYWEHSHKLALRSTSTPVGLSTTLAEDSYGLWFRASLAITPKAREMLALMELAEAVGREFGTSVGGHIVTWIPGFEGDPRPFRRGVDSGPGRILSFEHKEISLAAFPALSGAYARIARSDPASRIEAATDRMTRALGGQRP